ncbi:MAG: hypothetical protein LBF40_00470 [Deltaproteobacteria bacterium]|nr:hypothetical protein [Deltaproteobacteria bacterium]
MIKYMIIFTAFILLASSQIYAEGMKITGGKDQSQKQYTQIEKDVEAGKDQRDANTVAPLVPIIEHIGKAAREGGEFLDSPADPNTGATLDCGGGFMSPGQLMTDIQSRCSSSETNRQCLDRFERQLTEGYSYASDAWKVYCPEGYRNAASFQIYPMSN